ncbi:MAG: hypothetical protein ACREQ9_25710 [Candidatus Binatia bacterium]
MRQSGIRRRRLARLVLPLVIVSSTSTAAGSDLGDRLAELEAEIRATTGNARAESLEQCRAIAFGDKPCGGPWRYLVYSTVATDVVRLEKLVADYNALDERRNREEGIASDCAFVGPPRLALVDGRCVAGGR